MDDQYIQVRMSRELASQLREAGERLRDAAKKRPNAENVHLRRGMLSLGDITAELLRRCWRDWERGKRHRQSKEVRWPDEYALATFDDDGGANATARVEGRLE